MISVTELLAAITVLVFSLVLYIKWLHKYWARKNLPYVEATSIFGNVENPFNQKRGFALNVKQTYEELKRRGHKHGGMYIFTSPIYVPVDIDLIKRIVTNDFQYFTGHGFFPTDEERHPITGHLFNLEGKKWKSMRMKLTPTFTSGKMKMMYNTLLDCGVPMIEHIDNLCENNESLDIREILSSFTTDIIGSCVFGLECNSFKYPDTEFRRHGREIIVPNFQTILAQFINFTAPWLVNIVHSQPIPSAIEKFFINTVKNVIDYRKSNNIKRNDFIHLFMEMQEKEKTTNVESLTLEQIAAQSFLFFVAGFDTSASTMSFCLHELAFNQNIQGKLRDEIRKTMEENNGSLTYEGVMGMEYMDQVINETLRKYAPVPFLNRECTAEYRVPDSDITIEKGTKVFISTLGIHNDEEFYPDPEKFDPERFTEENKSTRPAFSFLPFGEGPRNCIGLRFGLMQTKAGLAMLLNNFKITPAKTEKYKFDFDPMSFVLAKKGAIMLNAEKLGDKI